MHGGHRENILAPQEADGDAVAPLYRIRRGHQAMLADELVAQGFGGTGQGVMRRDGEDEVLRAERAHLQTRRGGGFRHHAQGKIGQS